MKQFLLSSLIFLLTHSLNAQGWGEIQKIVSADRSIADLFGWSVAMDGNYVVVGARGGGPAGVFRGTAYVFEKNGSGVWNEIDQLVNIDNANSDFYGYSVAISGDYIFVGAIGQDYVGNGSGNYMSGAGAVYVYKNDGSGSWDEVQKIVASDREADNGFGYSVAIHDNYAIISVNKQDYDLTGSNFLDDAGAAYIFELDGSGTWNEEQKIVASDRATYDYFGRGGVAIDGNYAVVGANYENDDASGNNALSGAGSAYIFERDGSGTWVEAQKIVASDREQGEWFGKSVDISGNTIVVGAEKEYLAGNPSVEYGAVYIFEQDGSGSWNEAQKIKPSYLEHQSKFGQSVSIDGDHIIVGAYGVDIETVSDGGAAFMFKKGGSGTWNEVAIMYDDNAGSADNFGFDVDISGDNAMVGAYQEDEDATGMNTLGDAGSVYVFDINEQNTLSSLVTLSLVENNFEASIKAYPNPVKNSLNLAFDNHLDHVNIKISSILGKIVFSKEYKNLKSIEVPFNMADGMYLIEVKLNNHLTSILKIIKH